jgi:radical SAM/Cys-rich protein
MSLRAKSLKAYGDRLSEALVQRDMLEDPHSGIPYFSEHLRLCGMDDLHPAEIEILQINLGKMCNQVCAHCHVDAGPDRKEIMTRETMSECLDAIARMPSVRTVDLTGGAPELNPEFTWFVRELFRSGRRIIVRSNLTILVSNPKYDNYPLFFADHGVTVIASLPCYTAENTDRQRGTGVFEKSVEALHRLNQVGYGLENSRLELNLVYNPGSASLPASQDILERDYKRQLATQHGIYFNNLYTLTNMPVSRFLDFLLVTGKYEAYMAQLANAFNPHALRGLMCRNTVSVGWDGKLYDCDFNQMLELPVEAGPCMSIFDLDPSILGARKIVTGRHCYGCTAGSGSSCQGTIV